ncbi:CPBP family intramembrane glutamic endopeptidase [Nocardiopsis metallicus]|uniref:Membrane protease YdiL (CAAX protease family) n=1 Tax=Nocardiopsis metallicus TaxID=179819 RepID=A0A840WDR6_9ACTN|nr:CPBP family intramembrane glutamic endopeptidase [Nocardiopsis metallicus]MBB5494322.1 membrane protease YdiL (CAAX protease family) [Nocardiopsis metallicus]
MLAVALVLVVLLGGVRQTSEALWIMLVNLAIGFTALAPVAWLAVRGRPGGPRALVVAAALVAVSMVALFLPRVGFFADLDWNWQGKLIELVWLVVLFLVLRRWAREEAGLRWRWEPGSVRPVVTVIALFFLVIMGLLLFALWLQGDPAEPVDGERLLFDSTYPNLTEELLWRGAILAVLDRALGTPWRFFGAPVGWGLVLTSLGFSFWHGFLYGPDGMTVSLGLLLFSLISAVILGWVRARSGSVWPAYLGHCAPELGMSAALGLWWVLA